jgi:hypothetical protein
MGSSAAQRRPFRPGQYSLLLIQLDTEPPVTEVFVGGLAPGDSIHFQLLPMRRTSVRSMAPTSVHSLVIWQGLSADDNQWNDTVSKVPGDFG